MKRIAMAVMAVWFAMQITACSSQRELPQTQQETASNADQTAVAFLTAIGADELETAKSMLASQVTFETSQEGAQVLSKEEMEQEIDLFSDLQQEFNQMEVLESGENGATIQCYMPNYLTSMIFQMDREGYPCQVKIDVQDGQVTGMHIQENEEAAQLIQQKTAGSVGMSCQVDAEGKVVVSQVEPGWPAALAGIEEGDPLIAIDGLLTEQMRLSIQEPQYRLKGEEGTQIEVTVLQNEEEVRYTLTCEAEEAE